MAKNKKSAKGASNKASKARVSGSSSRVANSGSIARGAIGSETYNPNQLVPMENEIVTQDGSTITNRMETCQESLRLIAETMFTTGTDSSLMVNADGVNYSRSPSAHSAGQPRSAESAQATTEPVSDITPALTGEEAAEEFGMPTGLEDKIGEQIEKGLEKLREMLDDLDVAVTIRNTPDGKEIRFRNLADGATPTSDEKELPYQVLPEADVSVGKQQIQHGDKNVARLSQTVGGEPMTLAAVGTPTNDEGGSSSVVTQAQIEQEFKGLFNNNLGVNAVVNIGGLFVVQVSD